MDMNRSDRPHVIVRVTKNENEFPHMQKYIRTTKRIKEKYQKYNEKKEAYETWTKTTYEKLPLDKQTRFGGYIGSLILTRGSIRPHIGT